MANDYVSREALPADTDQLAVDEQLTPELVLVLPPELRAQALAHLGAPAWPKPRPRLPDRVLEVRSSIPRALGAMLATRALQLAVIFLAVAVLTVALAQIAQAVR